MTAKESLYFRDGTNSEQQNEILITYNGFGNWLNLGLGYKLIHKEDSSGEWLRENRPYIDLTLKDTFAGFEYSDRNRLEFRDNETKKDVFRYRNCFKIYIPHGSIGLPAKPYVAEEIFIQEEDGFCRNRIYTGFVWHLNKKIDVNMFYFFEDNEPCYGGKNLNVTGFEVKYAF